MKQLPILIIGKNGKTGSRVNQCLHHQVKYTSIPVDAYINALKEQGVPEDLQWLLHELFTVVFDGRNCHVMHGVEEVLERPPADFKAYVQKTMGSGVWNPVLHKEYT